jgi:transposase-like protein/ribosomal protein L37AE/L43A
MTDFNHLWERFPRTQAEFDRRFRTEEDCRSYLIEVRWGGKPRCMKCDGTRVCELSSGRFQCYACGHQTSVTAGTILDRTRKPLRLWFRALFEMLTRKTGVSGKDLQRLLGFGSYETAWTWLHKLRALLVNPDHRPLRGSVQLDEVYLGGKAPGHQRGRSPEGKAVILVGAEVGGRIRMRKIPDASAASLGPAVQAMAEPSAKIATDRHRGYTAEVLAGRNHAAAASPSSPKDHDPVQWCHWAASNLKRWWLGTHHGAISEKHAQAYLDEFTFRYNRRKTDGVGRLVARALEIFGRIGTRTMRAIVDGVTTARRTATA